MSLAVYTKDLPAITDETFEQEVLRHEKPVLLDFWATWCPSCKMLAPVLAEIARERAETLAVRSINADENPLVARNYQVMALPTLILFKDGGPVHAIVGARPKVKLLSELDAALSR